MLNEEEEEEVRARRKKETEELLQKNYSETFVKPVERAANLRFSVPKFCDKVLAYESVRTGYKYRHFSVFHCSIS